MASELPQGRMVCYTMFQVPSGDDKLGAGDRRQGDAYRDLVVDLEGFLAAPWRTMALMVPGAVPGTIFIYLYLRFYREQG